MDTQTLSRFHIPEHARGRYRSWLTQRYAGWIDASLFDCLDHEQARDPDRLFELPGTEVARDRRNLTARASIGGRPVWIKRFRPDGALDRLVYAGKQGKSVYAWNAAMALMEHGFCTPAPLVGLRSTGLAAGAAGIIAFAEIEQSRSLEETLDDGYGSASERRGIAGDLGRCLRRFHDLGFRHRDLRRGNILVTQAGADWGFCILDLNRLRVQPPLNHVQRLREIEKLNLPGDVLEAFFETYMPDRPSGEMAAACSERVRYAQRLQHLPMGRLLYRAWYYTWDLRAFSRSRRP